MTYWGVLQKGGQMLLGDPVEAVLSFDRDAPADQLKAVFPADRIWEDISEVYMYERGKGVFSGIVDEQNARLTQEGIFVELVCRSREALLLDSEAEPRKMKSPSLESLRQRLLEPLGFQKIVGSGSCGPGELDIEKGTSCWTVLAGFCRDYLDTEPYVDFEGVVCCGGIPQRKIELSQVMEAEICRLPCQRLSQVWKQGYRGGYDVAYSDPEAPAVRRRYISAQSGKNPRALLEESRRGSFLLQVTCAGSWWPLRGVLADVAIPQVGRFAGCPVRRGVYCRDRNGERTRFILERGEDHVADKEIGR